MHTDASPPEVLLPDWLPKLPPLQLKLLSGQRVRLTYGDTSNEFAYAYRSDWTQRSFRAGLEQLKKTPSALSMLILPYLSEEKLEELLAAKVSGLDLCGNALIVVPNRLLLRYSGKLNRFKNPQPLKDPYRGKTSLVGRALLKQPGFAALKDLHRYIQKHGGELSQSLLSRAVDQLEKDVVVGPKGGYKVFLLQPERLLDRLAESWKRNTSRVLWKGRANHPKDVLTTLFANAKEHGLEVALSGASSVSRYANLSGQGVVQIYAEQIEPILRGFELRSGDPFPNLELRSPPDPSVFFDVQTDPKGIRWASEVQTHLELASGDTRQREGAAKLREQILAQMRNQGRTL